MFRRTHTEIIHKLDLLHTALVVRDPGTSVAADAYDGLRKQVIAASTSRQAHAVQLAELDVALRRRATVSDLERLSYQWLRQAGIATVTDPDLRPYFESSSLPRGEAEVELPAYVIEATGQVVRQGRLRRRTGEQKATLLPQVEDELDIKVPVESPPRSGTDPEGSDLEGNDSASVVSDPSLEDDAVEGEVEMRESLDARVENPIDEGNVEEKS